MSLPLAEKLRPQSFDEVVGQEALVTLLKKMIEKGRPLSVLLWGPPGSGKTTIARLYAKAFERPFIPFTGVMNGIAEIKKTIQEAKERPLIHGGPIVFVDEVHRFNKAQQDIFLPSIEEGSIILIGATTENPSFAINNALLSRLRVLSLENLTSEALLRIITRYEKSEAKISLTPDAKNALISLSHGDGRHLLNTLENLHTLYEGEVTLEVLLESTQRKPPSYDRHDDHHYNLISALHKAVRGSDPDAALYYFARMLEGGEDPHYLARRLVRMAIEDIGLADPQALSYAQAGWQTYERLGSPEGELALGEVVLYLALAPKSNAGYRAYKKARSSAEQTSHLSPPKKILNAPTSLMKKEGYGKNYRYDHDLPHAFSGQNYFPDKMERETYYIPEQRGFEREMGKRIDFFKKLRDHLIEE